MVPKEKLFITPDSFWQHLAGCDVEQKLDEGLSQLDILSKNLTPDLTLL